jgi:mRNA interferase RelE/StbE
MRFRRLVSFADAYHDLTPEERKRVEKALRLLAENWRHPSLRVKRMQGVEDVWEARATLSLRITFQLEGDIIVLRNVGRHDDALKGA